MVRNLLIFPTSADAGEVERVISDELAPYYRGSVGFCSLSTSVGPLMGPAARDGGAGIIVEAVFESLETALGAIMSSSFEATKAAVDLLGAQIYLFEAREL